MPRRSIWLKRCGVLTSARFIWLDSKAAIWKVAGQSVKADLREQ